MKTTSILILRNSLLLLTSIVMFFSVRATAQTTPQTKLAAPRITQAIDEAKLVPMHAKVHPLAKAEFDRGLVADSQPMSRMLLLLQRSPDQEAALRDLIDQQQSKNSPNYHAWVTPQQFGQQFGVADADVQKVTDWLAKNGFTSIKVGPGHMIIEFSGTAGLVRQAFRTEMHNFVVNGEAHMANVSVPQVPAALAPVVSGVTLHNFRKKSFTHFSEAAARAKAQGVLKPGWTAGANTFALGPADFAKIYNVPTTGAGALDGTGQTIALVARSNINVQDINDYGNGFNIANLKAFAQASNVVLNGPDPGIASGVDEGDAVEATLDVEASGGVAPKANILLVVSTSSLTLFADGVDLSAIYIVENNLAPIMSESFGVCEAGANNLLDFFLWEQAAAQGITVMVSSGDSGSGSCDAGSGVAAFGLSVSGTASTPFNVAVGGTDFDDAGNPTTFWNTTNSGAGLLSAKSYIPEVPWNDSCAAAGSLTGCSLPLDSNGLDLVGGGGGQSNCSDQDQFGNCLGGYAKPVWQTGAGVPLDGFRDIPDVSLFASDGNGHASGNFWVICYAGVASVDPQNGQPCNLTGPAFNFTGVGGTSASSPAFAGVMALIDQKTGSRQGNANYVLYRLAALQATSPGNTTCNSNGATLPAATCTFNDVTKGNNSGACLASSPNCSNQTASGVGVLVEPTSPVPFTATTPAWQTTTGYDLATGLGSVNVTNLANNWANGTGAFTATTTAITSPASGLTITHGANQSFTIKVTPTTATGDVSIIASPPGSAQVAISSLTLPGTNTATLTGGTATFTTNALPGGTTYPIIARYGGDGTFGPSDSSPITITVNKESSQVAATLQIEDPRSGVATTASSTPYGNNYFIRVDVTNAGGVPCSASLFAIPCPTGTITLTDSGNPLNNFLHTGGPNTNSALLNNQGFAEDLLLGSNGLSVGAHSLSSTYAGDNSYTASTQAAPDAITITQAGIQSNVLANSGTTATVTTGQTVTLVATVVGFNLIKDSTNTTIQVGSNGAGPTGTVTFKNGATTIATVPVVPTSFNQSGSAASATASTTTTFAAAGTQTITSTYSGDANYAACTVASNVQPPCVINSATVTVTLPPSKVAFTVQPTNVAVTASITPPVQVSVEDSTGAIVTSATNPVTIAIGTNAGPGGVLGGTLTVSAVNGVATFPGLSINKTGTAYTLTASATGLTNATSSTFNVTGATGTFAISYSPNPLVLSSTTGAAAPLTVTVTPSGGFTGQVSLTATAASLPTGVTCPNSPLNINIVAASPVANTLNCQVTATSTTLTASVLHEQRMYDAKMMPPTQTIPPATGVKGWWALSAGTGFAALFLMFLPGGRKKYRAALGLGFVCLLGITLGCNGVYNGGTKPPVATTTQMTVTNASAKVNSGTAFTFSVTVTGGTPGGMAQLFDGGQAISTAGASATVSGGKATLTGPTTLSVGTHSISVHYLGDTTTLASQSGSLNLTVAGSSTIAVTTTPAATPAAAAINITVQ